MPLTYDQISNLQNWQTGHNDQDGCTYKATIIGTFGQAHQPAERYARSGRCLGKCLLRCPGFTAAVECFERTSDR